MSLKVSPEELVIKTLGEPRFKSPFRYSVCDEDEDIGFVSDHHKIIANTNHWDVVEFCDTVEELPLFERAGPRENLFFEPGHAKVAIVTCGGLCPGLNAVVRSLVMMNYERYGNQSVYGIRYGYHGLSTQNRIEPMILTPDIVRGINFTGGTMLGSSRGAPDIHEMVDRLVELDVDVLFTIGGDGTQKGALAMSEEIAHRGLNISVIGIPKTIDNDINIIDRSFGFVSAFSKACESIHAGAVEAKSAYNGISIVKLMGRDSGFIAARASLATDEVDFCLIPEMDFDLEGENGILLHLLATLEKKHHAVIVVAEGAGQKFFEDSGVVDASGNKKLSDIGPFLADKVKAYLKATDIKHSLKYIDPSYIIRSGPPTPNDALYCNQLGQFATHAAMSGRTAMVVGLVHNEFVHIPMELASKERKKIDLHSQLWQSVVETTGQPVFLRNSCDV